MIRDCVQWNSEDRHLKPAQNPPNPPLKKGGFVDYL